MAITIVKLELCEPQLVAITRGLKGASRIVQGGAPQL